jgi:hypothetical protein
VLEVTVHIILMELIRPMTNLASRIEHIGAMRLA